MTAREAVLAAAAIVLAVVAIAEHALMRDWADAWREEAALTAQCTYQLGEADRQAGHLIGLWEGESRFAPLEEVGR